MSFRDEKKADQKPTSTFLASTFTLWGPIVTIEATVTPSVSLVSMQHLSYPLGVRRAIDYSVSDDNFVDIFAKFRNFGFLRTF